VEATRNLKVPTIKTMGIFHHVHIAKRQTIIKEDAGEDAGGGLMSSAENVVTWDI
jgi:hypothetical protein